MQVLIGTKSGQMMLFDLGASTLLETIDAHTGPLWSLHIRPDGRGLVTGSADKDVKFWDFEARETMVEAAAAGDDEKRRVCSPLRRVLLRSD